MARLESHELHRPACRGSRDARMDRQCRRREFYYDDTSENTFLHLSVLQHSISHSTAGALRIPWEC